MYSFQSFYEKYSNFYISKHGNSKYKTVKEKIYNSTKLAELNGISIQKKIAPTAKDFGATISIIPYFIFAGAETMAMAQIEAIKNWNSEVNYVYEFCSENMLIEKGNSVLKQWGIYLG